MVLLRPAGGPDAAISLDGVNFSSVKADLHLSFPAWQDGEEGKWSIVRQGIEQTLPKHKGEIYRGAVGRIEIAH